MAKRKYPPMVGRKFGKLTVIEKAQPEPKNRYWICECECGNTHVALECNLYNGHVKSCGCLKPGKGGMVRSQGNLYSIWYTMRARCKYPSQTSYQWYGARGIKVCDEWNNSFKTFEHWAHNNGYQLGLTIDRINPDGNYEPENCQFLTHRENSGKHRVRINPKPTILKEA